MQWGAEARRDYSGWLTVGNHGEGGSEVVVHLSFGERSAEPEIREQSPEGQDPLAEGISATLESIRRQIEEGSGKVEVPPSSEEAEPQLAENPAVVDEDRPPDSHRGSHAARVYSSDAVEGVCSDVRVSGVLRRNPSASTRYVIGMLTAATRNPKEAPSNEGHRRGLRQDGHALAKGGA